MIGSQNVLKKHGKHFSITSTFLESADTFVVLILQISSGIKKIILSFLCMICTSEYDKDVIFKSKKRISLKPVLCS